MKGGRTVIAIWLTILLITPTIGWSTDSQHASQSDENSKCKVGKDKYLAECLTEPKSRLLHARTVNSIWLGTAPICEAIPEECGALNLYFWIKNNYGDGQGCSIGTKVLCVTQPMTNYSSTFWVGTAPFCGGDPKDCTNRGAEFIAYGKAGDGQACSTGRKVLCARR